MKAKPRQVYYSPTTFGRSSAGVVLADMLNQEPNKALTRKVSKFMNEQFALFMDLVYFTGITRKSVFRVMYKNSLERLDNYKVPDKFKSYMRNVIVYYHRFYLPIIDGTLRKKFEKEKPMTLILNFEGEKGTTVPFINKDGRIIGMCNYIGDGKAMIQLNKDILIAEGNIGQPWKLNEDTKTK